jgi:uroporphyrinogen-III decarboxylase
LKRKIFDRIFPRLKGNNFARGPMIAADHLAFLLNKPIDQVCRDGILLAKGFLLAQKMYDTDFLIIFADVSGEGEAIGGELEYSPIINPYPKRTLQYDEVKAVKSHTKGRLPELFKAADICRKELGDDFTIFFSMKDSFSLTAMAVGTEEFLSSLVFEKDKALDILHKCCKTQMGLITEIIQRGFIPLIGAPIASGGLIGGKNFKLFAGPCIDRLFEKAWSMDSFACCHICGTIHELIDELQNLQPDVLSFEDEKLIPLWDRLPETIPMGYIPTNYFINGDENKMRCSVDKCRNTLAAPYILSTGCDLPAKAKPELVKAMMEPERI